MQAASEGINSSSSQEVCNIVVLYDGPLTRARAMAACDYLVNQFWPEIELKFHWWRTDFLGDRTLAKVAAADAVKSDFLILCSETSSELSPALESWFETWLEQREEREGALVDLSATGNATARELFLREVSRRGNFDYLTAVPGNASDNQDMNSPVLPQDRMRDDMPGESRPPSHYGLNE